MGSSRVIYRGLALIPFALPVLWAVQEEVWGIVCWLRYLHATLILLSLLVLYIIKVVVIMLRSIKSERCYELVVFHLVKIPLFLLLWFVCMVVLAFACLHYCGFEGVQ